MNMKKYCRKDYGKRGRLLRGDLQVTRVTEFLGSMKSLF